MLSPATLKIEGAELGAGMPEAVAHRFPTQWFVTFLPGIVMRIAQFFFTHALNLCDQCLEDLLSFDQEFLEAALLVMQESRAIDLVNQLHISPDRRRDLTFLRGSQFLRLQLFPA